MAKLIVNPTSSSRREIPLGRALMSIGRDPSNDVVLPDAMVSRRHAVIEFRGTQYFLRDCNSSNGSLVNGDRISERSLRDGDLVAIGTARLLFREEAAAEEGSAKVLQHPSAPRLQCPSCHADHRKGDLFCRHCGASLVPAPPARAVCAACGTAVPLPARYCTACGTALPADVAGDGPGAPPPAAESAVAAEPAVLPAAAAAPAGAVAPGAAAPPPLAEPAEAAPPPASEPPGPRAPSPEPSSAATVEPPRASVAAAASPPASVRPFLSPSPRPGAPRPVRVVPTDRVPALPAAAPHRAEREPARAREASAGPAGFGARAAAAVLDLVAVSAVQAAMLAPAIWHWRTQAPGAEPAFVGVLLAVGGAAAAGIFGIGYYVYYWGVRGATPGKRLFGLCVQGEGGAQPPGSTRAAVRLFGYVVSGVLLGIGFLMAARDGRALHDRIAGTRVVRRMRG
jgi:pSer/pThr/pTyr-binding forkhead associated (FHA) protein/uncharacterized RDD family membrane protein YckC